MLLVGTGVFVNWMKTVFYEMREVEVEVERKSKVLRLELGV